MNMMSMAELTTTKLNAESHLLLVRYFLALKKHSRRKRNFFTPILPE